MPGKAYCDKIADPKERAKCRAYTGKYAKMKPKAKISTRAKSNKPMDTKIGY